MDYKIGSKELNVLKNSDFSRWSDGSVVNVGSTLVSNGDMESGTTGWNAFSNDTLTVDTGIKFAGAQSLKVVRGSTGGGTKRNISTVIGKLYKFSAMVYVDSASGANGSFLEIRDSANNILESSSASNVVDQWQNLVVQFKAVTTSTEIKMHVSPSTNSIVYFDDATLFEITLAHLNGNNIALDSYSKSSFSDFEIFRDSIEVVNGASYSIKSVSSATNSPRFVFNGLTYNSDSSWIEKFKGKTVTFGCWIKSSVVGKGQIKIVPVGGGSTVSSVLNSTTNWEYHEITSTISASITELSFQFNNEGPATIYFCQAIAVLGSRIGEGNWNPNPLDPPVLTGIDSLESTHGKLALWDKNKGLIVENREFQNNLESYERYTGSNLVNKKLSLLNSNVVGSNTLMVYVNGQKATLETIPSTANEYKENNVNEIEFGTNLNPTDVIECMILGNYVVTNNDLLALRQDVSSGLTDLLHPSDQGWADPYKSGYKPSFFNQQWGGAQWGQLPDGSFGDIATGYIVHNNSTAVGNTTNNTWLAQEFKVSENLIVKEVYIKIQKKGNPVQATEPIEFHIASGLDVGGITVVPNGTVNAINGSPISGKIITSNANGEWYRLTFAINPALTANTIYWLVAKAAVADTVNHFTLFYDIDAQYSNGSRWFGVGPIPSSWTKEPGIASPFLIVSESSTQFLQKNGLFDGKLKFNEGLPLNQSKGLTKPLKYFFNDSEFSYRGVWENLTKDKTFADFSYGLDHDRIVLRCNATTGFVQVDLYEQDKTKHTVTGTSDVSTGTHDIWLSVRSKGDGSDYLRIYVDGVSQGVSLNNQTFVFDHNFKQLGHYTLGGGFGLSPVWTQDLDMSVLPSAAGWTWAGTATEANAMSVMGGKLYQNKNGYGSNQNGFYTKTSSLNNITGYVVVIKLMSNHTINTTGIGLIQIFDSVFNLNMDFAKYYIKSVNENILSQISLEGYEHSIMIVVKGSKYYIYVDNILVIDGQNTTTIGLNTVRFGNLSTISGENADVIWDYVKYYEGSFLPEFTSGICHEASFFQGDKSAFISSMYNSGNFISTKEYCGIGKNYVRAIEETKTVKGIINSLSTTSASYLTIDDMATFKLGETFNIDLQATISQSFVGGAVYLQSFIDGTQINSEGLIVRSNNGTAGMLLYTTLSRAETPLGLHIIEGKWKQGGGTVTINGTGRQLIVETK